MPVRPIFPVILLMVTHMVSTAHAEPKLRRIADPADSNQAAAVVVANAALIHTTQLMPVGEDGSVPESLDKQFDVLFGRLDTILTAHSADRSDVVKLNFYVTDASVRDATLGFLKKWQATEAAPATCWVTTALPNRGAKVAIDAIIATGHSPQGDKPTLKTANDSRWAETAVLPTGDVVYVSGQAENGDLPSATRETLGALRRTLEHMHLTRDHIVEIKCFVTPMEDVAVVNEQIAAFFGESPIPPVSHVEWESTGYPIEIELVAAAPASQSDETVTWSAPPWMKTSPVYSRVATIHGNTRIYVSGLYSAEPGDGLSQVNGVFAGLKKILAEANSDVLHLAKATYYVSDDDASSQLNVIRPSIYDPKRPPAASKAMVKGVAKEGRSLTLDMIAAPKSGK